MEFMRFILELCFVHMCMHIKILRNEKCFACMRFNYSKTFCDGYNLVGEKSQLILGLELISEIRYPIRNLLGSDPKNGYQGGPDPDLDLDFTDSADPGMDPDNEILGPDNEILGPDIRIRTYYLFKIFKI